MTTTVLLLNLGILAFVLRTGLGTKELNRRRFTLPIAIVAVVGWLYLRAVPTSTGDVELIAALGIAGVVFGAFAGALMHVQRGEDGSLVTVAGVLYAAVWIVAIGGRLLFAYGANHWFAPQVVDISKRLSITGPEAWTSAFVIMALAMVLTRVAVTAVRGARVTGDTPWTQSRPATGVRSVDPTSR